VSVRFCWGRASATAISAHENRLSPAVLDHTLRAARPLLQASGRHREIHTRNDLSLLRRSRVAAKLFRIHLNECGLYWAKPTS
jgi:hypothetical protein